jgi:endonuclease YncB( thermonuclease family)
MRPMASGGRFARRRNSTQRTAGRRYAEYALTLAILLALLVAVAKFDPAETVRPAGRAVVNDGDTITLGAERIRLRGIDAPEHGQVCSRGGAAYDCGREARRMLQSLVADKSVACEGWERDKYGRLLAVCSAGGVELNRALVEAGWAVAYGGYGDAEASARAGRKGLWAGAFDRPRDWRDSKGGLAETEHVETMFGWISRSFGW